MTLHYQGNGGVFICNQCRKQCITTPARSHCCNEAIDVPQEGFPFTCTLCQGPCELAQPNAKTHEDRLDDEVLKYLQLYGKGYMPEEVAWKKITDILESERMSCERSVLYGVRNAMVKNLAIPPFPPDDVTYGFKQGIIVSLHLLDTIVEDIVGAIEEV